MQFHNFKNYQYPEEERRPVGNLVAAFQQLSSYQADFSSALCLFNSVPVLVQEIPGEAHRISLWSTVAARDGAMSIYHFGTVLNGIGSALLRDCPTIRNSFNAQGMRVAKADFEKAFPAYTAMRNAVAHQGDNVRKDQLQKHGIIRDTGQGLDIGDDEHPAELDGGTLVSNHLHGNQFSMTFEGKLVTYSISLDAEQALLDCVSGVLAAFPENPIIPQA